MTETFENFDLVKINTLTQQDRLGEAKQYLVKYFVPLKTGEHAFFDDGKWDVFNQDVIKRTYFNRMNKDLNEFYFKKFFSIKTLTCQLNKPDQFDNYINVCPKMKAKYKPYKDFDKETKEKVDMFLGYMKEVLANNVDECYEYLLKWYANMLKGNKNDSCIYMKGQQGIGKSFISDFLKDWVIGNELFLESGSGPIRGDFNKELMGKLLVQFSELENASVKDWMSMSSTLKRQITSETIGIHGKQENRFQIRNINNYTIDSNNDAIKDDEGRRYFILDVSHKHKEDHKYFMPIREKCFNDLVGSAFYSYMLEYDTEGFVPQKYPMTKSKLNSFVNHLDHAYEFLKYDYLLLSTPRGIEISTKDLYIEYEVYCKGKGYKAQKKTDFMTKLEQIGISITRKRLGNDKNASNCIVVNLKDLQTISNKNKWIHELDEDDIRIVEDDEEEEERPETVVIREKEDEIVALKKQLEEAHLIINKMNEEKERALMEEEDGDIIYEDEEEEEYITADEKESVKSGNDIYDEDEEEEDEEEEEEIEETGTELLDMFK